MPKYKLHQVHGMLLEEALAALLSRAGFRIVSNVHGDSTLTQVGAGIAVLGRGTAHQVDVIADFEFTPPFSYPPRLLLEAKFRKEKTGLDVVRNAVGMLRDVSEWFLPDSASPSNRYHYQAAIFSKTAFTAPAQRYAYAHDIVLVPLEHNSLFRPVITAISSVTDIHDVQENFKLSELRRIVRTRLLGAGVLGGIDGPLDARLERLANAVDTVGVAFLARTSGGFPLFLVPDGPLDPGIVDNLQSGHPMRVLYDVKGGWSLELQGASRPTSFSFDLPEELFRVFQSDGRLDPSQSIDMKSAHFDRISAFRRVDDRIETLVLTLDREWVETIRNQLDPTFTWEP